MTRTPEFGYSDDALRSLRETPWNDLWAGGGWSAWPNRLDPWQWARVNSTPLWDLPPDPVVDELRTHYSSEDAIPTELLHSRLITRYPSIV